MGNRVGVVGTHIPGHSALYKEKGWSQYPAVKYSINLVQRGLSANTHPVNGKSGKLYGHAGSSPPHGGVVYKMSTEDYLVNAHDLIGNLAPNQQWVPELELDAGHGPKVNKCDRCSKPAVAFWQSYFYCEEHAPNNATFLDGRPTKDPPPPTPQSAEPEALITEPVSKPSKAPDELPPEHMPAPAIGTDREESVGVLGAIGALSPEAPNGAPAGQANAQIPTSPDQTVIPPPPQLAPEQPRPERQPSAVEVITAAVTDRVIATLKEAGVFNKPVARSAARKPGKKPARPETEFTRLQKEAKSHGISAFGKSAEQLKAAIANVNGHRNLALGRLSQDAI